MLLLVRTMMIAYILRVNTREQCANTKIRERNTWGKALAANQTRWLECVCSGARESLRLLLCMFVRAMCAHEKITHILRVMMGVRSPFRTAMYGNAFRHMYTIMLGEHLHLGHFFTGAVRCV